MPRKNEADRILDSLSFLEPLEEVPTQVSVKFDSTLSRLVMSSKEKRQKTSWISGANHFALAAGVFAVFALGAVVTLTTGTSSEIPQVTSNSTTENGELSTEDQLLFSDGADSPQTTPDKPITISRSGHDYTKIPTDLGLTVGAAATWNSPQGLSPSEKACLATLQLDKVTNLIDYAMFGTSRILAVWSPVTLNSWYVYLIDEKCSAIDKKFVEKP